MNTLFRAAALAALLAAGAAFSGPAQAAYSATSLEANIMNSCKDFALATDGVFSAKCNEQNDDGDIVLNDTSFDIDTTLGVKYDSYGNPEPDWNGTDISSVCNHKLGFYFFNDRIHLDCDVLDANQIVRGFRYGSFNNKFENDDGELDER